MAGGSAPARNACTSPERRIAGPAATITPGGPSRWWPDTNFGFGWSVENACMPWSEHTITATSGPAASTRLPSISSTHS
jgi:hypothetical protein